MAHFDQARPKMEETRIGWETALAIVVVLAVFVVPFCSMVWYLTMTHCRELEKLPTPELIQMWRGLRNDWLSGRLYLPNTWTGIDGSTFFQDPISTELTIIDGILAERGEKPE